MSEESSMTDTTRIVEGMTPAEQVRALVEALTEIEMLEIDWAVSTAVNMHTASEIARAALASCDIEQIVAAMEAGAITLWSNGKP